MNHPDLPTRTEACSGHFEHVLGTSLEIQWIAGADRAEELRPEVETSVLEEIARLEAVFSTWQLDSELARWLRTRDTDVAVSADVARLLQSAEAWRRITSGAFDPAFAAGGTAGLADLASGPSPLSSPGAPLWSLRHAHDRWIARKLSDRALGFDAVAKGYIVDRAAEAAARVPGVRDVVINLGGDIRHLGTARVVVGVGDPACDAENAPPAARVEISGRGLATSGGYRRGEIRDGVWHSHLIDPRTGRSSDRARSSTVIAPSTEAADALATAFSVMAPADAIALADAREDVACLVIDGDGRPHESARWARYAIPEPPATLHVAGAPMSRRAALGRVFAAGLAFGGVGRPRAVEAARTGQRVPWDESFEFVMDFDFGDPRGGMASRRPYVVVYIDTADGTPVRTVSLWSQQASWVRELTRWYRAERARQREHGGDLVMSLASPTRPAGHYSAVWDGRDDNGNLVEQGEYFVCFESVRQGSSGYFTREPFTFETTPFQAQMADYGGFRDIQLDFRQRS